MKLVLKGILGVIGVCYLAVIILVTSCLLCYNDYKVTEMLGYSFIIIDDDSDKYNDGDLVLFRQGEMEKVKENDEIFFYEVTNGIPSIHYGTVTEVLPVDDDERTFTINDNHDISSSSLIGRTESAKVYPELGQILSILESRFGFLILVILPTLLLFLYELYRVIIEIKAPIEDEDE